MVNLVVKIPFPTLTDAQMAAREIKNHVLEVEDFLADEAYTVSVEDNHNQAA